MEALHERERAFENKFSHDEQLKFRVLVRRAKLLGLWAAEQMGLSGEEAKAYAKMLVHKDLELPGHKALFEQLMSDLAARGVDLSEHRVRERMAELLEQAEREIMAEE